MVVTLDEILTIKDRIDSGEPMGEVELLRWALRFACQDIDSLNKLSPFCANPPTVDYYIDHAKSTFSDLAIEDVKHGA